MANTNNRTPVPGSDTPVNGFFVGAVEALKTVYDFGAVAQEKADALASEIKEINGINIGMICYTYETDNRADTVALNGLPLKAADKNLVNAFDYAALDTFYAELEMRLAEMEADGAEATMLYIHWGDEYQLQQNATQSTIAQKMCDLGVDVIVGGHPHVIQPMELLTSTTGSDHKTVCIYSLGNIVSNQRREHMNLKTGHTEDGILFTFTFAKYSDGTVILEDVQLLPTWVDLHWDATAGKNIYSILPLDTQIEDWQTQFALDNNRAAMAQASYNRTMAIVGAGLTQVQTYLSQLVADTEAALGVVN